jgi:hypothetical protein
LSRGAFSAPAEGAPGRAIQIPHQTGSFPLFSWNAFYERQHRTAIRQAVGAQGNSVLALAFQSVVDFFW